MKVEPVQAFLDDARKELGAKQFKYEPLWGNSCQVFVRTLLKSNGLLKELHAPITERLCEQHRSMCPASPRTSQI